MRLHSVLLTVVLYTIIVAREEKLCEDKDCKTTSRGGIKLFFQNIFSKSSEPEQADTVFPGTTTDEPLSSWIDEVGEKASKFLQEKIFGQEDLDNRKEFLTLVAGGTREEHQHEEENLFRKLFDRLAREEDGSASQDSSSKTSTSKARKRQNRKHHDFFVTELLHRTTLVEQQSDPEEGLGAVIDVMMDALSNSIAQVTETFGDYLRDVGPTTLMFSTVYFLANQEAIQTPSWKRQQHRFYEQVSKHVVIELHDALYLSQLAYVNTVEDIRKGVVNFQDGIWELAYGTTASRPSMPAHFLLVHKNPAPWHDEYLVTLLPWETKPNIELQITLVVRGTKDLADAIADTMLKPVDFLGGKAHGGILASGTALVEKYTPKLKELLKHSGRDKIRLYIVGHSLGAGAGAIAAMQFNALDFITVEAVGFGCPSLLSPELSESTKDYITTVVTDADVIPRMSGSTMANVILDVVEFDWTKSAKDDINFTLGRAEEATPIANIKHLLPPKENVIQWAEDFFNRTSAQSTSKPRNRLAVSLIPPGNCIHFFRDGVGFTSTYTPCKFFSSIEFSRTMVEDHLVMPGYHRALITFMRDWTQDFNFDFVHDISSIPA